MFFADIGGIAWVVAWIILSVWIILSMIFFALYIICKIIDRIKKELE
jgi:hypothetical protein